MDKRDIPLLIKGGEVFDGSGRRRREDLLVSRGRIYDAAPEIPAAEGWRVIDATGMAVLPGLVDAHVHLREPGYSYKETIECGTRAAARGGFTSVCPMPNLNPVPDSIEALGEQLDIIRRDAAVEVLPYASITRGRLGAAPVDFTALAPLVAGFSDDGSGVQDAAVMRLAMKEVAATGKVLAAHCEVEALLNKGYIHAGRYARSNGHRGISSESEWREVERDIRLAAQTGCRLHICHVSTAESVRLVRQAKERCLPVTCETAAHYLAFCEDDLQEDGRFKMNPPLRSASDRQEIVRGLADGTIDIIASDHAPHSAEEKSRGLEKSAMGVTGLELSLPAAYTYGVLAGHFSMERLVELMALAPRRIFGIDGGIAKGSRADITVVDLRENFKVNPDEFLSKGKATPFEGLALNGRVKATIAGGVLAYTAPEISL